MKYQITRASDWAREKKPCSQAVYEGKDEYGDNIWTIEINSLADLYALMNEVGKIVIHPENEIQIYDYYIE